MSTQQKTVNRSNARYRHCKKTKFHCDDPSKRSFLVPSSSWRKLFWLFCSNVDWTDPTRWASQGPGEASCSYQPPFSASSCWFWSLSISSVFQRPPVTPASSCILGGVWMEHEILLPSLSLLKTLTPSNKVRTRTKKKNRKTMNATNTQKCLFLMDPLTELTRKASAAGNAT